MTSASKHVGEIWSGVMSPLAGKCTDCYAHPGDVIVGSFPPRAPRTSRLEMEEAATSSIPPGLAE
jgi:hypothetical protein